MSSCVRSLVHFKKWAWSTKEPSRLEGTLFLKRATQTDIDYGTDNVDVHKYISLARFQNFKFFFMSVSIFEQLLLYALA